MLKTYLFEKFKTVKETNQRRERTENKRLLGNCFPYLLHFSPTFQAKKQNHNWAKRSQSKEDIRQAILKVKRNQYFCQQFEVRIQGVI